MMKRISSLTFITILAILFSTASASVVENPAALSFPLGFEVNSGSFSGKVYISPMIQPDDLYNFPATNNIIFEPGARSSWHTHGGMIVLGTGGVGYYQAEGEPVRIVHEGDVVEIPAGVRYWHGAAPDSWFSQMVIYDSTYAGENESSVEEPVTDEYYNSLKVELYDSIVDGGFMFDRAASTFPSDNFSGNVWVSTIVNGNNAANAPELHYVVFDYGVVNNWHSHEGGQILIATDGIGYHQIEGQPVEILRPGDVVYCPPGVKHWHGGSADTQFAHIAINTNPEKRGVVWYDRISEEEYAEFSVSFVNNRS